MQTNKKGQGISIWICIQHIIIKTVCFVFGTPLFCPRKWHPSAIQQRTSRRYVMQTFLKVRTWGSIECNTVLFLIKTVIMEQTTDSLESKNLDSRVYIRKIGVVTFAILLWNLMLYFAVFFWPKGVCSILSAMCRHCEWYGQMVFIFCILQYWIMVINTS